MQIKKIQNNKSILLAYKLFPVLTMYKFKIIYILMNP